jgi:hypothetical protein
MSLSALRPSRTKLQARKRLTHVVKINVLDELVARLLDMRVTIPMAGRDDRLSGSAASGWRSTRRGDN